MARSKRHPLIAGARITGLGTLASRLLGMVRDMATAALLGLSGGGVMDAFVIAFRIPNLFRRLFGEGALAASYLPVLTAKLEKDRTAAWQLVSVALTWLAVLLAVLVVLAEGPSRARLWKRVTTTLEKLQIPATRIEHLVGSDNPALLANLLKELLDRP